ncbi:TonB-dependent receptor [Aureivirga marina]|uniref:TonB-dependent receptor n=1 Tax=Aureivirga marina TaxID=1182451 RepID=UPI001E583DA7|nr:TonB-dependent receptor [Aureivirga marina]
MFSILALQAQSKFQFKGQVINLNQTPLSGANITIGNQRTISDSDGYFLLSLEEGTYEIQITYIGYKTLVEELHIKSNESLTFMMTSDEVALEEVLVKSVRVSETAPVTHSNLNKKEIQERNLAQDIPVLMNFLPAVVTTSDAGAGVGYTGIRVRGSDATRVNVTINGIALNDSESQGTFWVNLPDFASSTQSIQLQRGVGTSTNGAGAFGASINLLTDADSEKAYGEIANSVGSFNTHKHTFKFGTGLINEHFNFSGRLSVIKSDGYIDRASSDLKSYFLTGSYKDENTFIKALLFGGGEVTYQAWNGIDKETLEKDRTFNPAGQYTDEFGNTRYYENEVDNYKQDHAQLHISHKFNENWTGNVAFHYTFGRGFYENYKEDEDFSDYGLEPITIGGETIETTDLVRRKWLKNHYYGTTFSLDFHNESMDVTIGGALSRYNGLHFGRVIWARYASTSEPDHEYYNDYGNKNDANIYVKGIFRVSDKVELFGDLQYRTVNYKANGVAPELVDDTFNFFNPKAGITYRLNDSNNLYFSYARANKEPKRTDYENDYGRPNNNKPKHETLNDFELGWRLNKENIILNTNFYYMSYDNQLVLTGAQNDVGSPIAENVKDSYRAGIEIDARIQLFKDVLAIQPNVALSMNKIIDYTASQDGQEKNFGNTDLSFSPNVIAGNIISFTPIKNLNFSFLTKYVGEQYMSNLELEASKLDSYFVNDLSVQYTILPKKLFKSITFTGLINNIFNEEYVSNGYFFSFDDTWTNPDQVTTVYGAGYYPQATRNFLVGVTMRF